MAAWLLALASSLSLLPLVLAHGLALGSAATPQAAFALSLLPWVVLAGLPGMPATAHSRQGLGSLAAALPILALAARLDLERAGIPPLESWPVWLAGAVCVLTLHFAARRAGAHTRLHAGLWILLVVAAPMLGWVVETFADPSSAASWAPGPAALANWSPLALCLRLTGGSDSALGFTALACLAATLVLLLVAAEFDRRRGPVVPDERREA